MSLKNLLNKLFGRRESLKDAKFDIPPQQSYAKYENNITEPTVPYPTQEKPKFVMCRRLKKRRRPSGSRFASAETQRKTVKRSSATTPKRRW